MSTFKNLKLSLSSFPRTIWLLGLASFFTDFSGEMIYPLLPVFLATVLGASALQMGMIEGIAEATASLLKVVSGVWTDRIRSRKPFILFGYGLSGLIRPFIGIAGTWHAVLGIRLIDRIGKGLRASPRDALIADVTQPQVRGRAYGFHRAMDHAGAVVGPLAASLLLLIPGMGLRTVFLMAVIPAILTMLVLFLVKETGTQALEASQVPPFSLRRDWHLLGKEFKILLIAVIVFALGNSTDAFLLIRLSEAGIPVSGVALLWSAHHVVKMIATYYGGKFSDIAGRKIMILCGWLLFGMVYLGFSIAQSPHTLVTVFLLYGVYFGLVEPVERAFVADMVPATLRGTAFGYFHLTVGLGALPASVLFGWIWYSWGSAYAFMTGASLSLAACTILALIRHR